jgi:hypothetical protein
MPVNSSISPHRLVKPGRYFAVALSIAFSGILAAQTSSTLVSGVQVDAITHSAARIGFKASSPGIYQIQYGASTLYGTASMPIQAQSNGVVVVTGMAPARVYHYRICMVSNSLAITSCSPDYTLTTAPSPAQHPARPKAPSFFDTSVPEINGQTFLVDEQCSNLRAQIALAALADGNLNHQILIPPGIYCDGLIELPAKRGPNPTGKGVVVIRPALADDDLPPAGVRISPAWAARLPKIVNNSLPGNILSNLPATCTAGDYAWQSSQRAFYSCTATNIWTPLSSLPGYSEGSSLPAECTTGTFFRQTTSTGDGRSSLYRCVAPNRFSNMQIRNDGGFSIGNAYLTAIRGWRFVGLQFEPADETVTRYGQLVNIGNYSGAHYNVVIDRCYFRVPPTSGVQSGVGLSGANVAVINSYFDLRVTRNSSNTGGGGQAINITSGSGPFKVYNNYIRGVGILLFANDNDPKVPRDSLDIRRNTFTYNDAYRCGSPESDGICRDVRGPIELKRGRRVVFDGNIIENFWSTLTGGQAFIITPRAFRSDGFDGNQYGISDVMVTNNIVRNGSGFMQIAGQDDVGYRNSQVTARFNISNNLIYNIDAYKWAAADYGPTRGQVLALAAGPEDVVFRHNTTFNINGTGPAFLHGSWSAVEGLDFRDNILWLKQGAAGGGTGVRWSEPLLMPNGLPVNGTTAKQVLDSFAPGYLFSRNVILGAAAGDTAKFRNGFPSDNFWPGDAETGLAALHFENPDAGDFNVHYSSPYKGAASDGTDPGIDMEALETAIGRVKSHRPADVSATSASVVFWPPADTFACSVDVSPDPTFEGNIRLRDSSQGRERIVTFENLQPNTRYFYRILCSSEQPEGEFTTLQ